MKSKTIALCVVSLLLITYKSWITGALISSGDLHYLHTSYLDQLISWPQIWHDENKLPSFYNVPILIVSGVLSRAGLSFVVVERLIWFYPFLFLSFVGAYRLSRQWMRSDWSFVAGLFYVVNTYSLMIIGGGQMGVSLGYAFIPWVFYAAYRLCTHSTSKWVVFATLFLSAQIVCDLRVAYVTWVGLGLFMTLLWISGQVKFNHRILLHIIAVLLLTSLLHAYWILPYVFYSKSAVSGLGSEYLSAESLSYFSFADFSHAVSWLHPNWPENIFGKTYFLFPHFLLFPIFAFGSMLFLIRKKRNIIHDKTATIMSGFGLILLVGALLSKGVNPPFGLLYQYLFKVVPGFFMFRDPTKFYVLVSLSYSIMIPMGGFLLSQWLANKAGTKHWSRVVPIFVVICYGILMYPAFSGSISGTLKTTVYPQEYRRLQELLSDMSDKYRVFWIPERSRFGYFSMTKSAFNAISSLHESSPSAVARFLADPATQKEFIRYRVGYVVVPHDTEHELFLTNRSYDASLEASYHALVKEVPWLEQIQGVGSLTVMKNPSLCPTLWSEGSDGACKAIDFTEKSSTSYTIHESISVGSRVVLSERFEQNWVASGPDGHQIGSVKTWDNLNSFAVPYDWSTFDIVYTPQRLVNRGIGISILTALGIASVILYKVLRRSLW